MQTPGRDEPVPPRPGHQRAPYTGHIVAALTLTAIGLCWALWPQLAALWWMWTSNALRSIGMLLPPTALLLTLRAWRGLDWKPCSGSLWGLPPLLLALTGALVADRYALQLGLPGGGLHLLPPGLLVWLYISGAVLLFAGTRAYRRAWFPIALLLLLNPVPQFFTTLVDYPMQAIGANTARHVALWLGLTLNSGQLRLMFSPHLGMFIAPGCNGLRGAVALGYLALIAGHLGQQRWWTHAAWVVAAVLLGYVFNLLRLSVLVLAYAMALHWPWLAWHMEGADYLIGGVLFCIAVMFLLSALQRRGVMA